MRMLLMLGVGTLITGCGYISEEKMANYLDADGDGLDWPADCDDNDPTLTTPQKWYLDEDGDGYGAEDNFVEACLAPEGSVTSIGDCDDSDATIYPNADDAPYDGIDSNCDGANDCDVDGDGYDGSDEGGLPTDACPDASDCDDSDPNIYPDPAIAEIPFNGIDDDCDLATGDGDGDGDGFWHQDYLAIAADRGFDPLEIPAGQDGDCFDAPDIPVDGFEHQPLNGFDPVPPEDVHPDATETYYDGIDQNCDGEDDFDQDLDGVATSEWPDRTGTPGFDCVDSVNSANYQDFGVDPVDINPTATDVFYDGVDQDCDGSNDFDQDLDGFDISMIDCDGDGVAEESSCDFDGDGTDDFVGGSDCDDSDNSISIDAEEGINDGIDQNCDGLELCYEDLDGDSFGSDEEAYSSELSCIGAGVSNSSTDCNDDDNTVYPSATEVCDGQLNDCLSSSTPTDETDSDGDGYVECAYDSNTWVGDGAVIGGDDCDDNDAVQFPGQSWFPDNDDDNYGDLSATAVVACAQPADHVADNTDCADDDGSVYPAAPELCDGLLNDCDGSALPDDEIDDDGDGYVECTVDSAGWDGDPAVLGGEDCDDTEEPISPAVAEIENDGVDQDCDGMELCYVDSDGDGFGDNVTGLSSTLDCSEAGFSDVNTDCDDSVDTTYPGAPETPVSDDENCDGLEAAEGIDNCTSVEVSNRYFLICSDGVSWQDAEAACLAGGYAGLASIDNASQNTGISNQADLTFGSSQLWIGYNDQGSDGNFVWSNGSGSNYEYWDTNISQPDGGPAEECVHMGPNIDLEGYLWQDLDCPSPLGFVCSDDSATVE